MQLDWKVEIWPIDRPRPLDKNPFGQIGVLAKERLRKKLQKLGNFDVATVDHDGTLLTFNKRFVLMKDLGYTQLEVKVPNRPLTSEERKEIIINSNVHEGEWIKDILKEEFADIDLHELGLSLEIEVTAELKAALDPETGKERPELPIVQRFDEKHDAFVIVSNSEIDSNFIKQVLCFASAKSYKSSEVGSTHIISATQFSRLWNNRSSSSSATNEQTGS